jgi:hypothetical protein
MMLKGSRLFVLAAAIVAGLSFAIGGAFADDRLTEIGARLRAVDVDKSEVTVSRNVVLGADTVTATYVTAHTASGKALQRTHLGFWVPWDGKLTSMSDNHFSAAAGLITYKILKDEDMSAELFPVRITLAYRTRAAFKFGVFELRESASGGGR